MTIVQQSPAFLQQLVNPITPEHPPLPMRRGPTALRSIGGSTRCRTIFAFEIPYLPDLMTSPNFVGATEGERLAEILNQNIRLITNLGKHKDMAFALRFHTDPNSRGIKLALIARVVTIEAPSTQHSEHLAADVAAAFRSFGYPINPVTTEADLCSVLMPFTYPCIVEIRQHEEVSAMVHGDAYVVHPFCPRPATWITLCQTMLQQNAPSVLSIYLEPTRLRAAEQQFFSRAAQLAETLADVQYEGYISRGRIVDPVARGVARLYVDYLQRFVNPFLLTIQVASPDLIVAENVANSFAAELIEVRSLDATQNGLTLPSGYDILTPRDDVDRDLAQYLFTNLELAPWGPTLATEGKERLRYLVDAGAAAAAFRFPVAVRGGIPGIRTRQPEPSHDVGGRTSLVSESELAVGTFTDRGGVAALSISSLTRHTLVAGNTRSGKTTTCMYLLSQLAEKGIPFLVIEPAKTEYRALVDASIGSKILVFTLGDESVSPFRLNPLEILPGVRVEVHISHLHTCFQAALPTFGVLPTLIEESLYNVYLNKGWDLTERGRATNQHQMPTLGDLYFEIIRVAEGRGYSDNTLRDIRAASAGRIASLLRGSKGRMLNTRRSLPIEILMNRPCILELESMNDDEKALVMLFVFTMIREHSQTSRTSSRLQHVTLIEEAHRVMSAIPHTADPEATADTRAGAAEMFGAALSEIGGLGEGLIISEQIPNRLVEDALKNTGTKIAHQLPGLDDRQTLGATMNLRAEQEEYLGKLARGQAAISLEGYERPTFIQVPNYKEQQALADRLVDHRVEAFMAPFWHEYQSLLLPFEGCRFCLRRCRYRDLLSSLAYEPSSGKNFQQALWAFERSHTPSNEEVRWAALYDACQKAVEPAGLGKDTHAAYCYFTHLWEYEVTKSTVASFWKAADR